MAKENLSKFDVIVVGSGPGGASVAYEMAKRKKKVLFLEMGDFKPITGSPIFPAMRAMIPFKSLLFTPQGVGMIRGLTTGGSSTFYYGTCYEPPYEMFEKYGVDIRADVQELKNEVPHDPLPDYLVGPMAKRIMKGARELGIDWQKLPKYVYPKKCQTNCDKCAYGCPDGAKWTSRMWVEEAINNNAIYMTKAKVTRVLIEGRRAVGVEYKAQGITEKAYAENIVISAGGIGTPTILRASGIKNAGYDFFFDPLITVMGEHKDFNRVKEMPMTTGIVFKDEGFLLTDQPLPLILWAAFTAQSFRFDKLLTYRFPKLLNIMVKGRDSLGGRLTDGGQPIKRLADVDRQRLMKGVNLSRKILKHMGCTGIYQGPILAAHPGGTAKINDVVDSNLQTEFNGLYVCDCSVIPEPWGLPPTLALLGLGVRLGKHLSEEKNSKIITEVKPLKK